MQSPVSAAPHSHGLRKAGDACHATCLPARHVPQIRECPISLSAESRIPRWHRGSLRTHTCVSAACAPVQCTTAGRKSTARSTAGRWRRLTCRAARAADRSCGRRCSGRSHMRIGERRIVPRAGCALRVRTAVRCRIRCLGKKTAVDRIAVCSLERLNFPTAVTLGRAGQAAIGGWAERCDVDTPCACRRPADACASSVDFSSASASAASCASCMS